MHSNVLSLVTMSILMTVLNACGHGHCAECQPAIVRGNNGCWADDWRRRDAACSYLVGGRRDARKDTRYSFYINLFTGKRVRCYCCPP